MNITVEIYCIKIPQKVSNLEFYLNNYLDFEEKKEFSIYKTLYRKLEFLFGRILLKSFLAKALNVPFEEIRIKKNEYGKPYLDNCKTDKPLSFNLTHSNGLLLLAISNLESIGIDVEEYNKQDYLELVNTICTLDEKEYIQQSHNKQLKNKKFLFLWTRKEALLKYISKGFTLDPRQISVPFYKNIEKKGSLLYCTFYPCNNFISSLVIESKNDKIPLININYLKLEGSNFISTEERILDYNKQFSL